MLGLFNILAWRWRAKSTSPPIPDPTVTGGWSSFGLPVIIPWRQRVVNTATVLTIPAAELTITSNAPTVTVAEKVGVVVTQLATEVATHNAGAELRVTQLATEIGSRRADAELRVTQLATEVANRRANAQLRISQLCVEVAIRRKPTTWAWVW